MVAGPRKIIAGLLGLGLLVAAACSTARKTESPKVPQSPDKGTIQGLPTVEPAKNLKSVVLVFGPGMAKAFSYAGVIKALLDQKISIRAVVGTEMGGAVAAFWASSRSYSEFEWKLLKLRSGLKQKSSALASMLSNQGVFTQVIQEGLGGFQLGTSRIGIALGVFPSISSRVEMIASGNAADITLAGLGEPGIVESVMFKGAQSYSAASVLPYPVRWAKEKWSLPVIAVVAASARVIQPQSKKAKELDYSVKMSQFLTVAEPELKQADLVLRLPVETGSYFDFETMNTLVFEARRETLSQMDAVKKVLSAE